MINIHRSKFKAGSKGKLEVSAVSVLCFLLLVSCSIPVFALDYLHPDDFSEESWSKTVDYLEYVDVYATTHGLPRPPPGAHAYLYMTYVNYMGVQVLYAGLTNITVGLGALSVSLPIQTYMTHFKTENQSRNVVTASSYIMLLAYNESNNTVFTGSPDRNDTLYASFSIGYDLSAIISTDAPSLNSRTTVIPLTHPEENRWSWGMTYTNLTAMWWSISIAPDNSSYRSVPVAVGVYEELTFTYDLIFNSTSNTAKIVSNYTVGRMTDLWVVDSWVWVVPVVVHYNNTGCYRLDKTLYSNETIHQFLYKHNISMSLLFFQASAVLDHTTESSVNGQDVMNKETVVSENTITTFSDEGEKIQSLDFREKNLYTLYNHTADSNASCNAITRTADRNGFAKNPIFQIHTFLMRYIPLALVHIDETLYEQAKNHLLNMTYADYFYIISYPTYDGYRIIHDPIHTVYFAPPEAAGLNIGTFLIIGVVAGVAAAAAAVIIRRKI